MRRDIAIKVRQALNRHMRGIPGEAKKLYLQILADHPDHPDSLHLLGLIANTAGEYEQAASLLEKSIAGKPNFAEAHHNLGIIFSHLGKWDESIRSFTSAIELRPFTAAAFSGRGSAFLEMGEGSSAVKDLTQAIQIEPNNANFHFNLGNVLVKVGKKTEAIFSYTRSIELRSDFAEAYTGRGFAWFLQGRLADALGDLDRAIALKPMLANAYCCKGSVLLALQDVEGAIENFDHAIRLEPRGADAHWNRALALLLSGKFVEGFGAYEWRWLNKNTGLKRPKLDCPLWLGEESVKEKVILLHCEQGLGDSIQFSRYASLVADLGGRVILQAQQPLVSLFRSIRGVSEVVSTAPPASEIDFHSPLMSMPFAFKTELVSIPCATGYLRPDSSLTARWRAVLGPKKGPRIGLVWSGRRSHGMDAFRSIEFGAFHKHLPAGIDYFCLQTEIRNDEIEEVKNSGIREFSHDIRNFSDTAALCENMDLVISVDTSVAHLGGAIGKPTWVLLPFACDWRWLLGRIDSPWYNSIKLFRQSRPNDWDEVLIRLGQKLCESCQVNGRGF